MTEDNDAFVVAPDTGKYAILRFLVRDRGQRFNLAEIAAATAIESTKATTALDQLTAESLVNQDTTHYYIDAAAGEHLKHRLESVDAATHLHDTAPDDAYARSNWEDKLGALDT